MSRRASALAAIALALAVVGSSPLASADNHPRPTTHWLSLINETHAEPTGMSVVIVPPIYGSKVAMADDRAWLTGGSPIRDHPGVRAAQEATAYWAWAIERFRTDHGWTHLQKLTYTVRVLGVDATPDDLQRAHIVVTTAMIGDPSPSLFHLGLGAPTFPNPIFRVTNQGMRRCTVWNTGAGNRSGESHVVRLRNLIIHEFGHCLAVGHTGTSLGLNHNSRSYGTFDSHPTDVMSAVLGDRRQCISNINVQSLAVGYDWLRTGTTWRDHPGETFILKDDYRTACMPDSMKRF
ncbi:MAG TPA: hypothetical protein VM840_01865 [Actinomycetota bacterium]|nr:hypothetical protein [Actinomycetota bacterium]